MIDASAGGALMNKIPEKAWELIESVADNSQHFKTRATSAAKGVYEVTPSESTILAKSLVDIVALFKEIKEGQQVSYNCKYHKSKCNSLFQFQNYLTERKQAKLQKQPHKISSEEVLVNMADKGDQRKTLGEFTVPTTASCGSSIVRPTVEANNFELKPALIH
ncbi:hypothetical protein PIB30_095868 [Stylosanthes scabra]|uniref:Uncharacterized protein n=1 Tax=Stylosanthes scabra TaxID=79078 RepID=A0ABU6QVC0_9FABA|nr:hypothetical protein [Stylosanthes scabra]